MTHSHSDTMGLVEPSHILQAPGWISELPSDSGDGRIWWGPQRGSPEGRTNGTDLRSRALAR